MPTPQALKDLKKAEERMSAAHEEHLAYLERPDRQFTAEARVENKGFAG